MAKKRKKQQASSGSQLSSSTVAVMAAGLVVLVVALLAISGVFSPADTDTGDTVVDGSSPQLISPQSYQSQFAEAEGDYVLIDVRTAGEFSGGHIVDSINIPVEQLQSRIAEVPQGMPVIVYCRSGNRSATAARILDQAGFGEVYDLGGVIDWQNAGYSLVN